MLPRPSPTLHRFHLSTQLHLGFYTWFSEQDTIKGAIYKSRQSATVLCRHKENLQVSRRSVPWLHIGNIRRILHDRNTKAGWLHLLMLQVIVSMLKCSCMRSRMDIAYFLGRKTKMYYLNILFHYLIFRKHCAKQKKKVVDWIQLKCWCRGSLDPGSSFTSQLNLDHNLHFWLLHWLELLFQLYLYRDLWLRSLCNRLSSASQIPGTVVPTESSSFWSFHI